MKTVHKSDKRFVLQKILNFQNFVFNADNISTFVSLFFFCFSGHTRTVDFAATEHARGFGKR
jgi:hypothetical protein